MKAVIKAAFYDRQAGTTRQPDEVVEMTAKRIDEINAAFPGYVEKIVEKRQTKRKEQ